MPVFGVAIPTADGIRRVLELVGASRSGGSHVLWHNLREEPVCTVGSSLRRFVCHGKCLLSCYESIPSFQLRMRNLTLEQVLCRKAGENAVRVFIYQMALVLLLW